jgi:hypothetical protein
MRFPFPTENSEIYHRSMTYLNDLATISWDETVRASISSNREPGTRRADSEEKVSSKIVESIVPMHLPYASSEMLQVKAR